MEFDAVRSVHGDGCGEMGSWGRMREDVVTGCGEETMWWRWGGKCQIPWKEQLEDESTHECDWMK